mmetsp:Transcript_52472/g.128756  ORF Transcript_52472/g.128756 Transcript_52472/m.128756 type:complete len:222 (-) Transcript_52472:248-913(-)
MSPMAQPSAAMSTFTTPTASACSLRPTLVANAAPDRPTARYSGKCGSVARAWPPRHRHQPVYAEPNASGVSRNGTDLAECTSVSTRPCSDARHSQRGAPSRCAFCATSAKLASRHAYLLSAYAALSSAAAAAAAAPPPPQQQRSALAMRACALFSATPMLCAQPMRAGLSRGARVPHSASRHERCTHGSSEGSRPAPQLLRSYATNARCSAREYSKWNQRV